MFALLSPCFALGVLEGAGAASGGPVDRAEAARMRRIGRSAHGSPRIMAFAASGLGMTGGRVVRMHDQSLNPV